MIIVFTWPIGGHTGRVWLEAGARRCVPTAATCSGAGGAGGRRAADPLLHRRRHLLRRVGPAFAGHPGLAAYRSSLLAHVHGVSCRRCSLLTAALFLLMFMG